MGKKYTSEEEGMLQEEKKINRNVVVVVVVVVWMELAFQQFVLILLQNLRSSKH
jgi:hypothetical protein